MPAAPYLRLVEARSLIFHGLMENASAHEEYIGQFRQLTKQIETAYDDWLLNTGRRAPRTSTHRPNGDGGSAAPQEPSFEARIEL